MPVMEDREVVPNDEMESQGKMFYGGIWWNSTWAEDMIYMMTTSTGDVRMTL